MTLTHHHHLLAGSFRSVALFLFLFDGHSLSLLNTIPANGPHQYIALGPKAPDASRAVYMTTWAHPPSLSSWLYANDTLKHTRDTSITATSSYITVHDNHLYSAGGPTGEVHTLSEDGTIQDKIQQFLFVPQDQLEQADKTRKALRYGSHAVEIDQGKAYVPVLGTNAVEMYTVQDDGTLAHLSSNPSIRDKDGPRHLVVSKGKVYVVTEHTNYMDVYTIQDTSLKYHSSRSLIPSHLDSSRPKFRGDTLVLHGSYLFATTRGGEPSTPGYISVFKLDDDGAFVEDWPAQYWETPTSGGKANAISILSAPPSLDMRVDVNVQQPLDHHSDDLWILLTDDCGGLPEGDETQCGSSIYVVGWNSQTGFKGVVSEWGGDEMKGASHAIWLD